MPFRAPTHSLLPPLLHVASAPTLASGHVTLLSCPSQGLGPKGGFELITHSALSEYPSLGGRAPSSARPFSSPFKLALTFPSFCAMGAPPRLLWEQGNDFPRELGPRSPPTPVLRSEPQKGLGTVTSRSQGLTAPVGWVYPSSSFLGRPGQGLVLGTPSALACSPWDPLSPSCGAGW